MNINNEQIKSESYNLVYYIYCALLFLIPFNARKVFPSQYTYFTGYFNEYVTYSISIADILAAMMILIFLFTARHSLRKMLKSEVKSGINRTMAVFMIWMFVSIAASPEYFFISFYQALRMSGYLAVAVMIKYVVNSEKRLMQSLFIIAFTGVIQGIIASLQFVFQSSIFGEGLLHKLSGESLISVGTIGTSNIIYSGDKIIRSYGTFPHPNILAGYLVITILITIYLHYISTQKEYNVNRYINTKCVTCQYLLRCHVIGFAIFVQSIGLLLTFSRSGLFSIFFVIMFCIFVYKIVSRETIYDYVVLCRVRSSHITRLTHSIMALLVLLILIMSVYFFIFRMQNEFIDHQSTQDRVYFENVSRGTILNNPVFGIGVGSYVPNLRNHYSDQINNYWQYQPDHNTFLLIAAEIGIPGLLLYLYLIYLIYNDSYVRKGDAKNSNLDHSRVFLYKSILIAMLAINLFDHYFWTSNQMRLALWILLGMYISIGVLERNVPRETLP